MLQYCFSVWKFVFNWRVTALQCCAGFCHKAPCIGRKHTYALLLELLSYPHSISPPRLSQSTRLSSRIVQQLPISHLFHTWSCTCQCCPLNSSHPLLPPMCPQVCVLCVSTPALQIGSSGPFFSIPYICINRQYLVFSFWLTSLCVTGFVFLALKHVGS